MFDGVRNNRRLKRIARKWSWFREDVFDAVSDFTWSRSMWVIVGNAATFLSALAALVHNWSRPLSFADYAVVQLACLACQAVALIPVVRPGRAATPRDVDDVSEGQQSLAMTTACGSWLFGVFPGAGLLVFFGVDVDSPPWAAVFYSGTAVMLACIAGAITAVAVSDKVGTRLREAAGPSAGSDWGDGGDGADTDSGGFDGD
ncbi:hypothetical protein ABZS61_00755 [Streptomyces sp. NPDC005566]|uniref:hypothetical protein n=1 Tax=Streptomyces sp. NPDC005566 TaxID=3156886 RepID=UPI00339EF0BE